MGACDSTEPEDLGNQSELVTRVILTLKTDGQADLTFEADDPDGDGIDFTIDDVNLDRNTVYTGLIIFEDNRNNLNITNEVRNEAEEHQVHYLPEEILDITVVTTDQDADGKPLGLAFTVTTLDATSGNMRVVLSHYDEQVKDGESLSDVSDVDITFPVVVGGVVGG